MNFCAWEPNTFLKKLLCAFERISFCHLSHLCSCASHLSLSNASYVSIKYFNQIIKIPQSHTFLYHKSRWSKARLSEQSYFCIIKSYLEKILLFFLNTHSCVVLQWMRHTDGNKKRLAKGNKAGEEIKNLTEQQNWQSIHFARFSST